MTTTPKPLDPADVRAAFEELVRRMGESIASLMFMFTAQGALGACLQTGRDTARPKLQHLTNDQLGQITAAASELSTLAHEIATSRTTPANDDTASPT